MGYEIHITRKKEWLDNDGPNISLEDWKAYLSSDPDMRLDGYAEATSGNGDVLRVEHEGLAVWIAYSGHGVNGNMAWLYPGSAGIIAKNPDEEIRQKMFEIAQALGARVLGDDGEEYGADGELVVQEDAAQADAAAKTKAPKRPWWKIF
ncbi:hypothetical protein [Dyella sp. GSA-30]|uniref:hypothetical protein n=1 Tax=Dyella sp. GSA-30 TaxID=2994496 RepID=UPI0024939CD7|nr:hypothetical protein [Dyella sp. GSA-30]BDU21695.1 hypothetical protein DYGSA30_31520 [Dyella sp. GSA-30]